MPPVDDMELLGEYVNTDSEAAFATLLNRHIHLVYSSAMRQVRDPLLASEVTQTTFIILARKARTLGRGTILSGWLYRTAQFAAKRALRTEARRREREREAFEMHTEPSEAAWEQLAPILDQAMTHLSDADRNTIVLRYFENKSSREVGIALGINEATAQKRVARAIDKLRGLCTQKGVVLPVVAFTAVLSANAVQAAPAVVITTTTAALQGAGISASTTTLIKGTAKLLTWAKFRMAALTTGSLLFVGVATVAVEESHWSEPRQQNLPISAWLAQLDDNQWDKAFELRWEPWQNEIKRTPRQAEAARAIQAMGDQALPFLLAALEREDSAFRKLFGKFGVPAAAWHHRAALGLDALGPRAKPLVPQLTRILHGTNSPKEAAIALAAIGSEGWEVLSRSILDPGNAGPCSVWALGSHRAAVPGTVEALFANFARNKPIGVDALTGWALVEIGAERERVIPLLTGQLGINRPDRSDLTWGCAVALGQIGPEAREAVPVLLKLLHDRNPRIRHDAAQALEQIDPQTAARIGAASVLASRHIPSTIFP